MTRRAVPAELSDPVDLPWERRPTVVHLTQQILKLQAATASTVVESVIAIGEAIAEIHAELPHGQWSRWAAEAVPLARQTLANYMALARWSAERPKEVERLAHLGPSKLYLLLPLPATLRRRLTAKRAVAVPGGPKKTVERMTVAELARVTGALARGLPGHKRMPVGRVLGQVRRSIRALDKSAEALLERAAEVHPADARALYTAVSEVAEVLRARFEP